MSTVSYRCGRVVLQEMLSSGIVSLVYSNIMVQCCHGSIAGCCDWKHIGDDTISTSSSITVLGSVLTLNAWNHLVVSTCKEPVQHRNDTKNFKV